MKKSLARLTVLSLLTATVSSFGGTGPWSGPYIGINGGYGWGNPLVDEALLYNGSYSNPGGRSESLTQLNNPLAGGTFGGQLGLDWQFSKWIVAGLEFNMDWSGLTGNNSGHVIRLVNGAPTSTYATFFTSESLTWFGNLLPRLGFLPTRNLLIYGTGGLAFGHVEDSCLHDGLPPYGNGITEYPGSLDTTLPGWAAGAGAEWLFVPHWSLSAEYLYNQLESKSVIGNPTVPNPPYQQKFTFNTYYQTIELKLNWRMNL